MPCFRPLSAVRFPGHRSRGAYHDSGKPRLYFGNADTERLYRADPGTAEPLQLPCGKCVGCRLKRAGDWALRAVHEYRAHSSGCFLTLTYATDKLPPHGSLRKADFPGFAKRLRAHLAREGSGAKIKYIMCGEYGPKTNRAHYHAVIFGWSPPDMVEVPNNVGTSERLFDSALTERLWTHGWVRVGTLTVRSAAYVARYTLKKLYGNAGEAEYEAQSRIPPYIKASLGIGRSYFDRYRGDLYPSDYVIDEESRVKRGIPRYYDKLLEKASSSDFASVKARRASRAKTFFDSQRERDGTPDRLEMREKCVELRIRRLIRGFESAN